MTRSRPPNRRSIGSGAGTRAILALSSPIDCRRGDRSLLTDARASPERPEDGAASGASATEPKVDRLGRGHAGDLSPLLADRLPACRPVASDGHRTGGRWARARPHAHRMRPTTRWLVPAGGEAPPPTARL